MLPLKHRLMLRHFPDFFVHSKKVHSPLYTIFYLTQDELLSRGAVIVPKKVIALATQRNKLKRQVLATLYPLLQSKENLSIAILVKRKLARVDLIKLSTDLN